MPSGRGRLTTAKRNSSIAASRGSSRHLAVTSLLDADRETEVGDAHPAVAVDHDVGRLEISVQHALVMSGRETRAQLPRDFVRLGRREVADPPQQRRQILAIHELHGQELLTLDFADIVNAAHVGVRHVTRVPHLGVKPFEQARRLRESSRQELERHRLSEPQVIGPEDLAHSATTEQSDDAIAPVEDLSGGE